MLKKKIKLKHLLGLLATTSIIIVAGFSYYIWESQPNLTDVKIPVKGLYNQPPVFKKQIEGEKKKEFLNTPLSVVASKSKVYVTDSKSHRINVYSEKGSYLFSFGKYGIRDGEFLYPNTLAIDEDDNIYVGEFQNQRIQVFNSRGKHQSTIYGNKDRVISPLAITVKKEKIYIVSKTNEIIVLDLKGELLQKFGEAGTGEGFLDFPNGIAVADDGRIFVSDSGNSRIQIFSSEGKFLNVLETKQNPLNLPRGIAIDSFGYLYVVDIFSHNIAVYNEELEFLFTFGERGTGDGQFNFPNDVFIDSDFRVFVTDRENNRISIFNYE